ncbi:CHASE4 domain-containing protein [Pseudoalteromonas sp. '520P1 No. 412']|uniref:CHASE4 domain-containing protein n=1 Tax=Pseudoalteromonas sp. '520P1 No. 412' TaxID=304208 RepID=UPI003FCEEF85
MQFSAFDLPSSFVEKNLLFSSQLTKPHSKSGYTFLENKLVQFSATSIFKANLKGVSNGTMIFWRLVDHNLQRHLQKRSGIKFNIERSLNLAERNSLLIKVVIKCFNSIAVNYYL